MILNRGNYLRKASHLIWIIIGIIGLPSVLFIGFMKLFVNPNIYGTGGICVWIFFIAAIFIIYVIVDEYGKYKKDK